AQRLALLGLILGPEVPSAALAALECVAAHQHAELEEVVHAPCLFERLVDARTVAGDAQILLELLVERRDLSERLLQSFCRALHAAVVPDQLAELTVEVVG